MTPLKGTRHQAHREVQLSELGPVGDRVFCLVDPVARQVLKTVANGSLLTAMPTWHQEVLTVELAGRVVHGVPVRTGETLEVSYWGRRISVDVVGGPWAEPFSQLLDHPVLLARARTGDIVYGEEVSVITTASLAGLRAASRGALGGPTQLDPEGDSARFRATFLVDTAAGPYERAGSEEAWIGRELSLGAARVHLTAPIIRCGVVDLHPVSGRRDLRLLDALPRDADGAPVFGLQGVVVQPGLVRHGSAVHVSGL